MPGILADINVQGQVDLLRHILESEYWREVWVGLATPIYTFGEVGLSRTSPDSVVWRLCQQRQLVLVTANRNMEAPDSLEATIQNENTPNCLPVFTLADAEEIRHSKAYAERVVERMLEYLLDMEEKYRGTGRLYLP
jgi:hypothetical protein